MKKYFLLILIVLFLSLSFFISGPFSLFPPGCRNSGGELGGCFGNQSMGILAKFNFSSCLSFGINNCAEPSLVINNSCGYPVTVNDMEESASSYISLDVPQGLNFLKGSVKDSPFLVVLFVSPPVCR